MNHGAVGKRSAKYNAELYVTGGGQYTGDLKLQGQLYGKVLRAPHSHARIVNINCSKALKLRGVEAVLTAKDIPCNAYGHTVQDQPVLASGKVRYCGDPVAAVAAVSEEVAEDALRLIKVEYELMQPVFDPLEAMLEDSPKLHGQSNICCHYKIRKGDVKRGFDEADEIVEDTYRTQLTEHLPIEPHVALGMVDSTARLTIWTSSQRPFLFREEIARVLCLPIGRIRVVPLCVGGGFGGKNEITIEPMVALFAIRTRKPVRMTYSYEDELEASTVRHPYIMEYKTGLKKDGTLTALKVKLIADSGAYCSWGASALMKATIMCSGPYRVPNIWVDSYLVYTNHIVGGALRGFGVPQVAFAYESHMDSSAAKVGIDPLELRLKNALMEGDTTATGQKLKSVGLRKTMLAVKEAWSQRAARGRTAGIGTKRGFGVASMIYPIGFTAAPNPSGAFLRINEDGTATIWTGVADVGQGSNTVLAQIGAEELGIPFEDITVISADTDVTPVDPGAIASRVTYIAGNAVRKAATEARRQLFLAASAILEANIDDIEVENGKIYVKGYREKSLSVKEAALKSYRSGCPIATSAYFSPVISSLHPETGRGEPYDMYVYATQLAEVEVDVETGKADLVQLIAAHDCGKAINPMNVEGQIEGGVCQGLGFALMEELLLRGGEVWNATFSDYKVPTALDAPKKITIHIVEELDPKGPYGAKGVGEPASLPTAPAICNAICDAIGLRIKNLPATPENLFKSITTARGQKVRAG